MLAKSCLCLQIKSSTLLPKSGSCLTLFFSFALALTTVIWLRKIPLELDNAHIKLIIIIKITIEITVTMPDKEIKFLH